MNNPIAPQPYPSQYPSQQPGVPTPAPTTDVGQYTLPADDDFRESGGSESDKRKWQTGGRKPCYPGLFDFVIRPLPVMNDPFASRTEGPPRPKVRAERHFIQLPSGGWYIENCPVAMRVAGARCIACEKGSEYAAANPIDEAFIKKLKPRTILFFWGILRNDPNRGPVIHEGHWSFDKLYATLTRQGVNPFDPFRGFDIQVHVPRKDSGERWDYRQVAMPSPLATQPDGQPDVALINHWISQTYDLADEAKCKSYAEQAIAYEKAMNKGGGSQGGGHGGGVATHNVPAYAPPGYPPGQPPAAPGYPPAGYPPGQPPAAPGFGPPQGYPPAFPPPGYPPGQPPEGRR